MRQITCNRLRRAGGKLLIDWSDGTQDEYSSLRDIRESIGNLDATEFAKCALLAWWLARSADGADPAHLVNRTARIDFGSATPIVVT